MIVAPFPGEHGLGRGGEALEGGAAPEFFLINPMTAFDVAVLLGTPRLDVTQPQPRLLDREREGEREFGAVVDLQFPEGKRECGLERGEERVAGLRVFPGIEAEDPVAGAVIDGGVLETLGAGHFDFFDVHLNTVSRSLATEECQLTWAPLGLPAKRWVSEAVADAANRGSGDPESMDALEPTAGADRPVLEVAGACSINATVESATRRARIGG